MKKIGLDIRLIEFSGIGTTIRGFLDHLGPERFEQLILFGPSAWNNPYPCEYVPVHYPVYGFRQHLIYSRILKSYRLSLLHVPHYDVPLNYRGKFVSTVHDLIHFLHPEYSTKPLTRLYSRCLLSHVSKRAAKIICVSENTKRDLIANFPAAHGKVEVIPGAVDERFRPMKDGREGQAILSRYKLTPGYLLYVGNLRLSKNIQGLLKSYRSIKEANPRFRDLVLVGKNSLKELNPGHSLAGVVHLGTVPGEHLPLLYSMASLFVFPSFYEGFGLPPLEAMACGTPTLVSSAGSLKEVCAGASAYANPSDTAELGRQIVNIVSSPSQQERLRRLGLKHVQQYSWSKNADSIWRVYEEIF